MKLFPTFLLCCAIFLAGCSKSNKSGGEPAPSEPPAVRAQGTPVGDPVKKNIGAAGGTLLSKDNTLRIDIPAGALAANTEISVQAVTNTLPGSPGPAYRLLPENVKFAKPVKLTFHYTDRHLDSTGVDALFMAFQSADGIWRFIPTTTLNTTAKTLSVETTHFSSWAPFAMYWLRPDQSSVEISKSTGVFIYTSVDKYKAGSESAPIAIIRERVLENSNNIRNWRLTGAGVLTPEDRHAFYRAPAKVPTPSTVTVAVDIHNFIPPNFAPNRGAAGKLILLARIKVVDDVYFSGTVNGLEIFCIDQHHKYIPGGWINISGLIRTNHGFSINIENVSRPIAKGQYQWFAPDKGGTVMGVWGTIAEPVTITGKTFYNKCDENGTVEEYIKSPGLLVIHEVENIGGVEYIRGELRGEFYPQINCGPGTPQPFELSFRTKNIQ
ncbi:hypothetical protein [Chitinophaga rhizosphaerae]|uniref:hypothetical protein n=1 Tax=Chitinophaga rhizosphaerae TaxID=1864947 RepID=UPI000F802057|nr:hypothetical protein [Chitinophaga rhizosphaerae]